MEKSLEGYKESGVTALYLMGVFQRDNAPIQGNAYQSYGVGAESQFKKADASPLAVTSRTTPCAMLGGEEDFQRVVRGAKQ